MKTKINFTLFLVLGLLVMSCKKEGCMDSYALNYDADAKKNNNKFCVYNEAKVVQYAPIFGANSATLRLSNVGIETNDYKFGPHKKWHIGSGAKFTINGKDLVSAGHVSFSFLGEPSDSTNYFDSSTSHSDNFYWSDGILQYYGLFHYPDTIIWKGTGDVWPAFNVKTSIGFTGSSTVQSGAPTISSSYTMKVDPIPDADSLALQLFGQRSFVTQVIPADQSSYTFSQATIKAIGRGPAVLRVISIRYGKQVVGGRTYYILNTRRSSKSVNIGS